MRACGGETPCPLRLAITALIGRFLPRLGPLVPPAGGPSSCVPSNIGKWITRFAKTRQPKPSAFERDGPTRRGENRGTLIFSLEFLQLKALLKSGIGGTIFIIGYLLCKPDPSGNPNSRSKDDGTTLAI